MAHAPNSPSNRLRYFLVFALGILIGVGVTATLGGGRLGPSANENDAIGTFLPRDSIERLELIDRETVSVAGLQGTVETRGGRGIVVMEVAIDSASDGEITVEYDDEVLSPRGFNQENATAGEIRFKRNEFQLLNSGANRYQLTFRKRQDTDSSLRLRISGEGADEVIDINIEPTP